MIYLSMGIQALLVEIAGVLLIAGGFYLYDKKTSKNKLNVINYMKSAL